jgi:hypothetical protein
MDKMSKQFTLLKEEVATATRKREQEEAKVAELKEELVDA